MTTPTIVESHLNGGLGDYTPSWTNTPASGDLLVVCGTSHNSPSGSTTSISGSAGWTGEGVIGRWFYYRFADGSATDLLPIKFTAVSSRVVIWVMFRNVSAVAVPSPSTTDYTSAHDCDAPTATPGYKDDMLLTFHTGGNATSNGEVHLGTPSGMTAIQSYDTDTPSSSHRLSGVLSYLQLSSCAETGVVTSHDVPATDTLNRRTGFTYLLEADPPTACGAGLITGFMSLN